MADKLTTTLEEKPQEGTVSLKVKNLWMDAVKYFAEFHAQYKRDIEYLLEHRHYKINNPNEDDLRRIKPTTGDLYNIYRHKRSQIAKSEIYFDVWPNNAEEEDDKEKAEAGRVALDSVIRHPKYGYRKPRRRLVGSGLAGKIGVTRVLWDEMRQRIIFKFVRPTRFLWEPGTMGPEDPDCSWVMEETYPTLKEIRANRYDAKKNPMGWKNVDKVSSDTGRTGHIEVAPEYDGFLQSTGSAGETETKRATILFFWQIDLESTEEVVREVRKIMKPEDRFLFCPNCGFEHHPEGGGQDLTNENAGYCPNCSEEGMPRPLKIATGIKKKDEVVKYPRGRLIVCHPHTDTILYDGPWPEKMSSFPYMTWQPYEHIYKPWGTSDVELHKSIQNSLNASFRFGYEQMHASKRLFGTLEDGIKDYRGEVWQFGDWQGNHFFAEDIQTLQQGLREFQGQALPSGWSEWVQGLRSALIPNAGTGDIHVAPGESKKIPVGTVQALQETGEVPVDDHIESLRENESIFFGVVLDILKARWDAKRWIRWFGAEGEKHHEWLSGMDLPDADVRVTALPKLKEMKLEQVQAMVQALQVFQQSEELGVFALEAAGVPSSRIEKLKEDVSYRKQLEQMLQQLQQQNQQLQQQLAQINGAGVQAQGAPF